VATAGGEAEECRERDQGGYRIGLSSQGQTVEQNFVIFLFSLILN